MIPGKGRTVTRWSSLEQGSSGGGSSAVFRIPGPVSLAMVLLAMHRAISKSQRSPVFASTCLSSKASTCRDASREQGDLTFVCSTPEVVMRETQTRPGRTVPRLGRSTCLSRPITRPRPTPSRYLSCMHRALDQSYRASYRRIVPAHTHARGSRLRTVVRREMMTQAHFSN